MSRRITVVLVLLLFLLPFVSWYYLNSGLRYRKDAQHIMSGTMVFPVESMRTSDGKTFHQDQLQHHVTLLAWLKCTDEVAQRDMLLSFQDQFKDTKKANIVLFDSCAATASWLTSPPSGIFVVPCPDTLTLKTTLTQFWEGDATYALVDRHGVIRSYYPDQTDADKKLLLEHMALLLPRERSDKVELKRNNNEK